MKIKITKIGDNYCMSLDDKNLPFCKSSSDILTAGNDDKELNITSDTNYNGIFSVSNSAIWFFQGTVKHLINFTNVWNPANYNDPPLEINRRVNLVRDTFAKADAEKKVWKGAIGEPEKFEVFTAIYNNTSGNVAKDTFYAPFSQIRELVYDLPDFARLAYIFRGQLKSV